MRLSAPVTIVLSAVAAACMRTPLQMQRHVQGGNAVPAGHGAAGGAGGGVTGTGGATMAKTADAGWATGGTNTGATTKTTASSHTGGTVATGGVFPTGGRFATGGNGTGGRGGAGGSAAGGSMGSGGRNGTGGSATGSGGRRGTGGTGSGGSGRDGGAADGPTATGGTTASGGNTGRDGSAEAGPACGNGIVEPGEECDLGADNRASTAFSVTQAGLGFAPLPLLRSDSGAACYDYRSSSAHTGFEAVGTSRIMLYLDRSTFALSLLVFHGIDKDSTGEEQPESLVQMLFSGLPETTAINVGDESNELLMTSATTATGFWQFRENTDGGVLGGLPFPGDWIITIEPTFTKGISTWTWIGSDGSLLTLDPSQPLTIESRSSHGHCRPDCTVPTCGDGTLDGGELCDDGQPSASGCSINCQSFN